MRNEKSSTLHLLREHFNKCWSWKLKQIQLKNKKNTFLDILN
jgi:hypothetical protein